MKHPATLKISASNQDWLAQASTRYGFTVPQLGDLAIEALRQYTAIHGDTLAMPLDITKCFKDYISSDEKTAARLDQVEENRKWYLAHPNGGTRNGVILSPVDVAEKLLTLTRYLHAHGRITDS